MVGTLYAFLAASGSFGSSDFTGCVVDIDAPFGMPRVLLFSCTATILHSALCPTSEIDAAESMKAVVVWSFGGLAQPEVLVLVLSSSA